MKTIEELAEEYGDDGLMLGPDGQQLVTQERGGPLRVMAKQAFLAGAKAQEELSKCCDSGECEGE